MSSTPGIFEIMGIDEMMSIELINRDFLEGNDCFGCGHLNENGLKIAVFRDSEDKTRLIGRLEPKRHMTGFPGMTHGGVIYTALDCLPLGRRPSCCPK